MTAEPDRTYSRNRLAGQNSDPHTTAPRLYHIQQTKGRAQCFNVAFFSFAAAACRKAEITSDVFHSVPGQYLTTVPSFANRIVSIECGIRFPCSKYSSPNAVARSLSS